MRVRLTTATGLFMVGAGTALALAAASCAQAKAPQPTSTTSAATTACRAAAPAELANRPLRWMGPCVAGKAEGPGVLRLGTAEPFQFFTGTMKAGRPVRGVLKVNASQLIAAYAFDRRLEAIVPDGNRPAELDATFRTGSAGAAAAARRFAAAGNKASAAYYQRMADQYREPPFE
jgi:hypothetical protein